MRVHGDLEIRRRKDVKKRSRHGDYKEDLERDFHSICGYCAKPTKVTKNAFEIDHFIPFSLAPELKNEYSNLVYSCYMCNRKKSYQWPTKDKNLHHNGREGFVDPASEEYDLHLERLNDGRINPLTEVGKYMCSEGFQFDLRPMKEIWLCTQILRKQEQLECMISDLSQEQARAYMKLNMKLKKLLSELFIKKE